ncbi:MAG: 8-amino-7-oxononanoate synthase [Chloroflexi bacterium]|nr:8-amino-7-oxononanoate synthase [Chloroflexota bacterium]
MGSMRSPTRSAWAEPLRAELAALEARSLRRSVLTPDSGQDAQVEIAGRRYVHFTSNNYLGLATDPRVKAAAQESIERYGASVTASRLLAGSTPQHDDLERRLAALNGHDACLLFSAGYLANLGVMSALAIPGCEVFSDALNHASIIDGCRLARAQVRVYPHGDTAALAALLAASDAARKIVVSETVFSMDGDVAPLPELVEIAGRYEAALVLDEAHAVGVFGPGGEGMLAHFDIDAPQTIVVGTLSKAIGSVGGFVAAERDVVDYLLNRARPFIFNTALPPAAIGAAHAALDIVAAEPERRVRLRALADDLRGRLRALGFDPGPSASPIVPAIVGPAEEALAVEARLRAGGVLAKAVRPPTVPEGTSRIRFNVMATHRDADVAAVSAALGAS